MAETLVQGRAFAGFARACCIGFALTLLAACLPTQQRMGSPTEGFAGPRFDVEAERFVSFDGAPLGLTTWAPEEGAEPWAVLIGLHGMNDYAGTFHYAGPWFAARGVITYAYDARGFGRSPRRGVWGGERLMTEDVRAAVAVARRRHPSAIIAVIGDSMGAATAIAAAGDEAGLGADRLILVAPAVWGWKTLPNSYATTLWVGAHTFPWRALSAPRNVTRRITASDNREALLRAGRDPHMIWRTRIDAVYGLVNLMEAAADRSANLHGPVLFLYGAHDQIIPRNAALAAAARLPATARTAYYENGYHWLLRDLQAEVVYADILAFLGDAEAPLPSGAGPLQANH
ncbi:MAG TPA: alpha/beta fold hydrolase [Terricaulis sp.]|nr:alpha/beta fold hydrolase [Terricaulis sp.]